MSLRELRYAIAVSFGVLCDVIFFWKFQPYATREHGPDLLPWYVLPILTLLAGTFLTIAMEGKKRWIPVTIFGGFCAANLCLIVADCSADPTNHNLWPFEFVMIAAATAPAFLGVAISTIIDRARKPQS